MNLKHAFICISSLVVATTSGGCATSFTGSAYVENGRSGCETKCQAQGLEFVGMVHMGEYSDACVCAVPGEVATVRRDLATSGGVTAGAVGVILAMRERERSSRMQYGMY